MLVRYFYIFSICCKYSDIETPHKIGQSDGLLERVKIYWQIMHTPNCFFGVYINGSDWGIHCLL